MPIKLNLGLFLLLFAWFVIGQSVKAAVIDDLYDASVAVDDQSDSTQNTAISTGLKQVLIKVRGNNDLLTNQTIKNALTRATRFVRSFSYDRQGSQLYLVISFDPQRVENVIRDAGFPVWDKRRPETIIWLAIQSPDDLERQIASPAQYPEIYHQLRLRAAQRGISLIFPVWDLNDIQSLGIYDIWGGFSAQISEASERYAVPSILSARIYLSDKQAPDAAQNTIKANMKWTTDWTLIEGKRLLAGQLQDENPLSIATGLVDALADQLSLKYAIDLAQSDRADTKVQIVVNNIDTLVNYSQALQSLENMSVVHAATLIKQQGTQATFELELLGDIRGLSNALRLDTKIRPVVDDFGQPIAGLEFFWVK